MSSNGYSTKFLFSLWRYLAPLPLGKFFFSKILGYAVPYSGTLGARVLRLKSGHVVLTLHERWRLRNHLGSLHAMALANGCELGSGLALLSLLPPNMRGILIGFSVTYTKKARGVITIECDARAVEIPAHGELVVSVQGCDSAGAVVVTAVASWRVGLVPGES